MTGCPFCERIAAAPPGSEAAVALAFPDEFPVSEGHTLIVPRRHIERLEALPAVEWTGLFALVHQICREVAAQPGIHGLNVGVNSGEAAGQTIAHAHIHIIPRRLGDVADPRGGVRHVIPGKAEYWSRP